MLDEKNDLGSPKGWLKRAKSNLIRAKQPKHEEVFWEDLCFDAQQAVENRSRRYYSFIRYLFDLFTISPSS